MAGVNLEVLRRLLDEHSTALILYARQWCSTPEDVVQEVMLELVRQREAPASLAGWLYRAVRNRAINAGRSSRRRVRHEATAAMRGEPWLRASEDDRLDAEAAAAALAELPIEQREAIVARLWGSLPFEEIAKLADTSLGTIYRRYQQGIAALREKLEGICPNKKNRSRP